MPRLAPLCCAAAFAAALVAQDSRVADAAASRRAAYAAAADYSAEYSGQAVLVLHEGEVVFERAEGRWKTTYPHPLASGTKSFSGVAAAFAVQDGLFASWDEPVSVAIPAWKDDPRKSKITLRHLLSLSSGLDPGQDVFEKGLGLAGGEAARRRAIEKLQEEPPVDDFFAAALALPAVRDPGESFRYGPSHFYAFGAALEAKLKARAATDPAFPADVPAYMAARFLDPLGIAVARWGKDRVGHPNLPGGATLAPREWAKFGEFVRRGGVARAADGSERRLLKPELLDELFKPSEANPQYGLTWWLPTGDGPVEADAVRELPRAARRAAASSRPVPTTRDGRPIRVVMAAGLGKQRLYVIRELGLTIVRFAPLTGGKRGFDDADFLAPIVEALR
jgi:CubicO group peptidase (beta-lactamase class C family)